ncbi:MAG: TfuA domain protein core [Caulobacteraceae bacterium]|nr:TfuA domain protein core [Caulobacteraceae bacterium]
MTSCDGRIVVFAGPSLPPASRPADPIFVWRPPAVAGDACRLAASRPKAVVLIDGLFDEQPAIRHKELLELIARGIVLVGGASMGALRAAELSPFGMIGVGRIFEGYVRGYLVADEEVALLHGPEDWEWGALTEPLVNVRATLLRAMRRFVIDAEAARLLLNTAMRIFYKERTWPSILSGVEESGLPGAARSHALRDWLPGGRVDLKRRDALACLDRARSLHELGALARPFPPRTVFSDALLARVQGS